jgi:tRNA(Ile)-lysidine synthase
MKNFLDRARLTISRMIVPGDKVLIAVSGGPDSVMLLYLLNDIREEFGIDLCIAHMDHMARQQESQEDARFVKELGEKLGLETYIEKIDVLKEKEILKTSFQETARILRYRFLLSTMKRANATKLALGHNADDQVETILINLIRGSGLKGLGGMPESRGEIIRPLIECTRTEIEDYLAARGLESRIDRSNASKKYLRNRIRHELIPTLKNYNENITSNLLETAKIIRDDDHCLDEHSRLIYEQITVPQMDANVVELDREQFNRQPLGYQKRLLRQAIFNIRGNLRRISTVHIQQIIELFKSAKFGKRIDLPDRLTAVRGRVGVKFQKNSKGRFANISDEPDSNETELVIPGSTTICKVGINLHAKILTLGNWTDRDNLPRRAFLDFDKTGPGIQARFFRPGDRFIPLGMTGRKKLKAFFIDEKIPRESRELIPILTTRMGDIIWIYGKRISEKFRVTEKTRNILHIEGDNELQPVSNE